VSMKTRVDYGRREELSKLWINVEQVLLDEIERCCCYVEAEIEYKRSRFCSEIARPSSQLEA
jgi:hypothetical protein